MSGSATALPARASALPAARPTCLERRNRALVFLAQLAAFPAGYRVGGVWGWAHPHDFDLLGERHPWITVLSELEERGGAETRQVLAPSGAGFTSVFRITQPGIDTVARAFRQPVSELPAAREIDSELGRYVSVGAHAVLAVLRRRAEAVETLGWTDWNTLRREAGSRGHRVPFGVSTFDTAALLTSGLIEQPHGRGVRPELFRATPVGRTADVLQWWGPHPESDFFGIWRGERPRLAPLRSCVFYGSGH